MAKKTNKRPRTDKSTSKGDTSSRALTPTTKEDPRVESGQPGGGQGRTDVTGVIRDKVRVDLYVTEGQPGYEETGPSEIAPHE